MSVIFKTDDFKYLPYTMKNQDTGCADDIVGYVVYRKNGLM